MKKVRWISVLASGVILAACAAPVPAGTREALNEGKTPTCDPGGGTGGRSRGWVLFQVVDPEGAAAKLSDEDPETGKSILTDGGDDRVIVRADVVAGDFNLVIPVDAADEDRFHEAVGILEQTVGQEPASVLCVLAHVPWPPHRSHTFVTGDELEGFYLGEYDPPGRHPQSPGANPWG